MESGEREGKVEEGAAGGPDTAVNAPASEASESPEPEQPGLLSLPTELLFSILRILYFNHAPDNGDTLSQPDEIEHTGPGHAESSDPFLCALMDWEHRWRLRDMHQLTARLAIESSCKALREASLAIPLRTAIHRNLVTLVESERYKYQTLDLFFRVAMPDPREVGALDEAFGRWNSFIDTFLISEPGRLRHVKIIKDVCFLRTHDRFVRIGDSEVAGRVLQVLVEAQKDLVPEQRLQDVYYTGLRSIVPALTDPGFAQIRMLHLDLAVNDPHGESMSGAQLLAVGRNLGASLRHLAFYFRSDVVLTEVPHYLVHDPIQRPRATELSEAITGFLECCPQLESFEVWRAPEDIQVGVGEKNNERRR